MLPVIVPTANTAYELPDSTGGEIEFRSGLIDYYSDQIQQGIFRANKPHLLIPPENLVEHLTLHFRQARDSTPGLHRGNDHRGTLSTYPEPGRGGLGHLTANLVHAYEVSLDKLLPKDTHDVRIAFARESYCGTEILHRMQFRRHLSKAGARSALHSACTESRDITQCKNN